MGAGTSKLRHSQGRDSLYVGTGTITTTALAAGAEEDLTITDSNAAVGDVCSVSPADSDAAETGMSIALAWCETAGTIKVRVSNLNAAAALTAEAKNVSYSIMKTAVAPS